MPFPVKPVHKLDLHEELFDFKGLSDSGMSGLQLQLLGVHEHDNTKTSSKVSERDIRFLEIIDKKIASLKEKVECLQLYAPKLFKAIV